MQGLYVELGIDSTGKEGTTPIDDDSYHFRGGILNGFVANPQMDGWIDYNGDFFTPGTPECGFGITYTLDGDVYSKGNNFNVYEIPGSITDFSETPDSILVTWEGMVDSLQINMRYLLRKDEHVYTTEVALNNLGSNTFTDVYYYHNFDPDNNQSINFTFTTTNSVESQSGMENDSVIVSASQTEPWVSEVILLAKGTDWKGARGGFSNRNGADIWNSDAGLDTTQGITIFGDQAIALSHKTASIPPGKADGTVFSFATAFSRDPFSDEVGDPDPDGEIGGEGGDSGVENDGNSESTVSLEENDIFDLTLVPNPSHGHFTISASGNFTYEVININGKTIAKGTGNNTEEMYLSHISKGLYLVKLQQKSIVKTVKLILN